MDTASPCTPAADYRTDATRVDGWTSERQALFLETLAHSGLVSEACREAGMSPTSAYVFRRRADGAPFALGWKAAVLLARDRLEDMLLEAAIAGVETVTTKEDGVTRRRAVNSGLSMAVLNRLDRHAAALDNEEAAMARAIGSAFEAFIDLIASGGSIEDLAVFLEIHPDPLAVARTDAPPRAESPSVALARKLAEKFAVFADESGAADGAIISARNQRRLNRTKKRRLGAR
jgi:hypothetical protein